MNILRKWILVSLPLFICSAHALDFTDNDLAQLLQSQEAGMIYLWSPHMPLSDLFKKDAKEVAGELSIHYTELLDPHTAIKAQGVRTLNSKKILETGALNHYPAILLYKNGKLLKFLLQGHEEKKSLRKILSDRLEQER